jgi:hypothetical protein
MSDRCPLAPDRILGTLEVDNAARKAMVTASDRFRSITGLELGKNVSDVHLDSIFRNRKFGGDLFVSLPSRD